ncbi:MAG: sugar ABC transporter ATP-binding protein, partial [Verrucomicrobiota bacterium]
MLELRNISKSFGPVQALSGVSLEVRRGEVVGLIGENGAGKSTLMKVLGGVHQPTSGEIRLDDLPTVIRDAKEAERQGISFVHQELNLLDNLDIAGNLFLGREPRKWGFAIEHETLRERARPLLDSLGLDVEPETSVAELSNGQKQLVEIAKALSMKAQYLILDEPTSSLAAQETEKLLALVKQLREKENMGVIFISHRLAEVEEIADRVVALRDGELAGELEAERIQRDPMISLMIGRDLSEVYPPIAEPNSAKTVIEVEDLATTRWPQGGASFAIREVEILGMAGLVGAGRSE